MSLKIHGIGASRASRPLWAALELGLQFEHSPIHYQGGATRKPDFLALNPNGHIPVLEDVRADGTVTVWESMACTFTWPKFMARRMDSPSHLLQRKKKPMRCVGVSGP